VKKTRAAAAAIIGLALTATGVLAAAPHLQAPATPAPVSTVAQDETATGGSNDNHGGAVSAVAKPTDAPETTTPDATDAPETVGAQGTHGALVSAVAQDKAAVGGPNGNHGGAVSTVARGTHGASTTHASTAHGQSTTHGASATHGKSTGKSQAGTHPASH